MEEQPKTQQQIAGEISAKVRQEQREANKDEFLKILEASAGLVATACKKANISRGT